MSVPFHLPQEVFAGDTWEIHGTLKDNDGHPFNLTGSTIEWAFIDEQRNLIIQGKNVAGTLSGDAQVTVTGLLTGQLTIVVPFDKTLIPAGVYSDLIRLTVGANRWTLWQGQFAVLQNPLDEA